ncbi:MAG: hypothetical protein VB096_02465 [Pseudoflavonifractor sp.]|nr:hypothetical protein [Pseudoflavonifractor sp.]
MADFTDVNSPVWRNVDYDDTGTQTDIMRTTHQEMVNSGRIVQVPSETTEQVGQSFPDLRSTKKAERVPILRQKMNELKASLRQFLGGLRGGSYEFEVNGNVLEAKLYDTGIREVMDKVTQDKASMLYHSDQVFQNAQYLYSTPDYDGDPNIYRWNYFYTPVRIGDQTVGVRIAVRNMVRQTDGSMDSQIYNWNIKRDATLGGGERGAMPDRSDASSVTPQIEPSARTSASETPTVQPVNAIDNSISNTMIPQTGEGVKGEFTPKIDGVSPWDSTGTSHTLSRDGCAFFVCNLGVYLGFICAEMHKSWRRSTKHKSRQTVAAQ